MSVGSRNPTSGLDAVHATTQWFLEDKVGALSESIAWAAELELIPKDVRNEVARFGSRPAARSSARADSQ